MSKRSRILTLVVIILVAIFLILYFSPILKSKPIAIVSGFTYQDTIMPTDAPVQETETKRWLRVHIYSLDVAAGDTYTIDVSSLSDAFLQVWEWSEQEDRSLVQSQILEVDGMTSETVNWNLRRAGTPKIYVDAYQEDTPAEYTLRVTKVE